ncbi:MAG: cyanophycin synthetase [Pseudomonadota bacterium]
MKIVEQRLLRGPNLYTRKTCLLTVLDLQDLAHTTSAQVAGFTDALMALLPSLHDHRCSVGQYNGFMRRLADGTYMGHVTEHVALALQCEAGAPAGFGRTRAVRDRPGHYRVVCAYQLEALAIPALRTAVALVDALAHGRPYQLEAPMATLRQIVAAHAIGPSTGAVLDAARRRGMPFFRLTPEANLFQLGWGSRQKRLQATITGNTDHIAVGIAADKQLTKALLKEAAVPVPEGGLADSERHAVALFRKLGGPVAVKPLDGNHGRGVTALCATAEEVAAAFARARQHGRRVIVERHVTGQDYRVLVAGNQVVAAALRRPPAVSGDGLRSIRALVEQENRNPARGAGHANILTRIALDEAAGDAVRKQGHADFEAIPARGQRVILRSTANLSVGGTAEDVTDLVPQETRDLCVRAARKVGLDVAGIDLMCADIGAPLRAQGGAIIEVNAAPGIRMHQYPSAGSPRDAGGAILEALHGSGDGRIPLIAITGTNGKTTTTLMVEHCVRMAGLYTGCTTTEGIYMDGKRIASGDCSGYWSARTVLAAPEVDLAILETARGGILKRGLAFDLCEVGVVLNVSADHLGLDGVDTLAELAQVKAVVARTASKAVVLNAEDASCLAMRANLLPGAQVLLFALDARHPELAAHRQRGGRAAFLSDGDLVLADGACEQRIVAAHAMPSAQGGHARHNIANALAAAAALHAAGFPVAAIGAGLASFVSDHAHNPLRANVIEVDGRTVLVDYAHNPAAYRAMAAMVRAMSAGRTVAVVTAPGDRRDADLEQIGRACGEGFDQTFIYEEENRGRAAGATAAMIEQGARSGGGQAQVTLPVREAFWQALHTCRAGDVLLFACGSAALLETVLAAPDAAAPAERERLLCH